MLFLNRNQVEALLDLDQLVDALAPAMIDLSHGEVSMPPRVGAFSPDRGGMLGVMPVYLGTSRTLATKLITLFPNNEQFGLPSHIALIAVFDPDTGQPIVLMDGEHITAVRTAAGSALATRLLARPDADVLVIVGSGVQARSHAIALPRVQALKEIRIVARDPAKASRLAEDLNEELDLKVTAVDSLQEAAVGAGIVCGTTHSEKPVIHWRWLEPGTHINSVGFNPKGRELDDDTVVNSLVVVESSRSALAPPPAGSTDLLAPIRDGLITEDHIRAEIGEVISGEREGRTSPDQVTLYKSVGVAVQDATAARLVLDAAREQGVGTEIEL